MANIQLTQELVREYFNYKDGLIYWKVKTKNNKIGEIAGYAYQSKGGQKRMQINFLNDTFFVHRIIFLWHNGYLPEIVDHKDRNPLNNKIENLRPATAYKNQLNRGSNPNTSSIYKGVSYSKRDKKWYSSIKISGKQVFLGSFVEEKDAAIAYNEAAILHHKDFCCLNII